MAVYHVDVWLHRQLHNGGSVIARRCGVPGGERWPGIKVLWWPGSEHGRAAEAEGLDQVSPPRV